MGSHLGSLGKSGSDFRVSCEVLSGQFCIIDITSNRSRPQHFTGTTALLGRQFEEPLVQSLIGRQPGHRNLVQFIQALLCLLRRLGVGSPRPPQDFALLDREFCRPY